MQTPEDYYNRILNQETAQSDEDVESFNISAMMYDVCRGIAPKILVPPAAMIGAVKYIREFEPEMLINAQMSFADCLVALAYCESGQKRRDKFVVAYRKAFPKPRHKMTRKERKHADNGED